MSDERRKFILLKDQDEAVDKLLKIFNAEIGNADESIDFILSDNLEKLEDAHRQKPVLLTTEPGSFKEFLSQRGEIAIDPELIGNKIVDHLIGSYSKLKKGIYQNFTLGKLLEYQNSFKVIDFSRLGFYSDIIHLESHENDFHPVKIRTFLDLSLMFLNYLTQEGMGSFPAEIDIGRSEKDFILSVNLRNQGVQRDFFAKMFQPISSSAKEDSLLSLICSACDLMEIQVDRNTIKLTGLWSQGFNKKQNSLIFLYDLERNKDEISSQETIYEPNLESLDKGKHYERLAEAKDKKLPIESEETLNYASMKISAKFIEELAIFTKKTLKPQFIKDLNIETLRHVLEGHPEQEKIENLNDEHCEKIIALAKELAQPGKLLQKKNGSLDKDNFVKYFSMTDDNDFLVRVKGFIEAEDPYTLVKGLVEDKIENLVSEVSVDHLSEDIIKVKGRYTDLEETIMRVLSISPENNENDFWVVKSLSQYLSKEDFPESELEQRIRSFVSKVEAASKNRDISEMKPKLKELSEDWHVKSLDNVKEEISDVMEVQLQKSQDPGDKAVETLSNLLLTEKDKIGGEEALLKAANEKLNKEKDFYKRSNDDDKKRIIKLKEEVDKLSEELRMKNRELQKEKILRQSLQKSEEPQEEVIDETRYEEFEKEVKDENNFRDQEKMQQILSKAAQLNKDLLEAEKVIKQMQAESHRQQSYYNKELDKALRKSQAAQNVADKAKAGLIRVANTNQAEIKSLKRSLDRVQNELMTSNGKNMTRIKDLEKENHTLNAANKSIHSKFEVIQSKYEKLLNDKSGSGSEEDQEKIKAMEAKLKKTSDQLQQALSFGKELQGKVKNNEFHEQRSIQQLKELERTVALMKKNEKKLLDATGKRVNPETGEVEGAGMSGKGMVENRDKLITANNKILDLKKRLHAVERDRDNFMRKLKTLEKKGGSRTHASPADSIPKAQHDRLEESFKLLGEDFKKNASQLETARQEVNEYKTKARSLEAEKQQLLQEIATLKKRNAA